MSNSKKKSLSQSERKKWTLNLLSQSVRQNSICKIHLIKYYRKDNYEILMVLC